MKIYRIKDEYIAFLRTKDSKVLTNKEERRPYVGIVYSINNLNYYIPLTSPKPKHKKMKNTKDFHKIKNGEYGAINFNKMLPVKEECIVEFNFKNEQDKNYRMLLQNQYKEISALEDIIKKKAENIYKLFHTDDSELTKADLSVKNRCCDFDLLEQMCVKYRERP
ncbi:MAG: type III toxin-antitoxin system ToxN/AbiQ family toxin [Clostridium sp.]|nr:type III toxin-antitoxin system ToxN/AbiQ family toxin [Clostridium sp.]